MSRSMEWIATLGPEHRPRRDTIPRRQGTDPAPLSFGQQRLWFVARMARVLGVEVSLRLFFETPTVAGMTQRLVAMEQAGELGE